MSDVHMYKCIFEEHCNGTQVMIIRLLESLLHFTQDKWTRVVKKNKLPCLEFAYDLFVPNIQEILIVSPVFFGMF